MKDKIKKARDSFKHINWKLISDGAIIFGMIAMLIGFIFLTNKIYEIKKEVDEIKVINSVNDLLHDEYDVDPKIKID